MLPGLSDFDKVLKAFRLAKRELGEILSSFEMMDKLSIDVSMSAFNLKNPLTTKPDGHDFYVLMETSGSNSSHDEEKLSSFVEKALEEEVIEDGTMTTDPAKIMVSRDSTRDRSSVPDINFLSDFSVWLNFHPRAP